MPPGDILFRTFWAADINGSRQTPASLLNPIQQNDKSLLSLMFSFNWCFTNECEIKNAGVYFWAIRAQTTEMELEFSSVFFAA